MKKKYALIVLMIIVIALVSYFGSKNIKNKIHMRQENDAKECSEVIFDFIQAVNNRDIDKIDNCLCEKTPIDGELIYYDKEEVRKNLEDFKWNIIMAHIGYISFFHNRIRMSILFVDENQNETADCMILEKKNGVWKISEIHGEGLYTAQLFKVSYQDNFNENDITYWNFPKYMECNYNADYQRLQ